MAPVVVLGLLLTAVSSAVPLLVPVRSRSARYLVRRPRAVVRHG
ncbi:hypothetical protein FAIPA1_20343 [Frankia sp. AiPs1]